jgi:hypothetical protein
VTRNYEREKARIVHMAESVLLRADADTAADAKLAAKIVDAVKAYDTANEEYNDAEAKFGLKRKEKQIAAGKLLFEARKRHPTDKAFEKFLELAGGIGIRRAQDFIAFAVGRKDFDQHQAENAAAQQRHRDKLKADKLEREKAQAALPKPEPKKPEPKQEPEPSRITRNAPTEETTALWEFEYACRTYLPKLNAADLKKASDYLNNGAWKRKEAA